MRLCGEGTSRSFGSSGDGEGQGRASWAPGKLSCPRTMPVVWLDTLWSWPPQTAMDVDLVVPNLFGTGTLCNEKLKGPLTQCISHLVSQGEGTRHLWRQICRGEPCVCVCGGVVENLGCKGDKKNMKGKMQKRGGGNAAAASGVLHVVLTFLPLSALPSWQMLRCSEEWRSLGSTVLSQWIFIEQLPAEHTFSQL